MSDSRHSVKLKTGSEPFRADRARIGPTVLDFWQWSGSDLLGNAQRGIVAEFLVAQALGAASEPRREWSAYDILAPAPFNKRVEVKSAAYWQSWPQTKASQIRFGIAPTAWAWDAKTNQSTRYDPPERPSDVFVFCLLGSREHCNPNPLNLDEWKFWVVATSEIDEKLGDQKTIGRGRLSELWGCPVGYADLADAILKT